MTNGNDCQIELEDANDIKTTETIIPRFSRLAIDIETMANVEKINDLPDPAPPANYKKPETIAEWMKGAKEEQIGRMALDPFFGRVCSVAMAGRGANSNKLYTLALTVINSSDEDEARVLRLAWEYISRADQIIGFNSSNFDIPFMKLRSIQTMDGLVPAINCQKYDVAKCTSRHFDCMEALHQCGNFSGLGYRRNLRFYIKSLLGNECPYENEAGDCAIDKSNFAQLIAEGRQAEIEQVGKWDAWQTLLLAEKIIPVIG